ncbi:MAG TPA: DUF72 domain-containing protein [Vicinamibacterales bacterium]|nr:DUF72 domain-containing protein [Vicinamibacterales bacterium]
MRIHVGTSGYNYTEWKGTFYPPDLPAKQMFGYYSARFHTVEINYTFYRMPTDKTTSAWLAQAPPDFMYTLKAPQRITHIQKLQGSEESLAMFAKAARVLGDHLACLLFQLPPTFRCDLERLRAFLAAMPAGVRPAFEFRHDSWLNEDVYALLGEHHAALCIADFGTKTTPLRPTARHGYFRLRDEGYQVSDLARWADEILAHAGAWDDVFVYFKHEDEGKGPEFAKAFLDQLAQRKGGLEEGSR